MGLFSWISDTFLDPHGFKETSRRRNENDKEKEKYQDNGKCTCKK